MSESKVLDILKDVDAVTADDHFVATSGKHTSLYIRKDKLYPHTELTSLVCREFAEIVKDKGIEVVVGPALGGIVLSQWTAHHLGIISGDEVLSVFSEKSYDENEIYDRPQILKRGYDKLLKNKRVLVVEDLTTTGASVKKVVERVREAGGEVVMVLVMVNRNPDGVNEEFISAPFGALAVLKAEAYDADKCPMCDAGKPINTEVGHGKEYLEKIDRKKLK